MQKIVTWIDDRFPLTKVWNEHLAQYYAPKNFNFWYYFGSLALLVLVNQIVTGIFLTMNYKPDAALAFGSVQYIMYDVSWGWLIRYMHSVGASMFFVIIYLHMFRGLLYGSHRQPRELIWIFGALIFVALMAEAFMGYLLPWGNMSYWGAQVIISLFTAIPYIGNGLAQWIRGDFVVSDATLNRFFAFHVIALPLVIIVLVFVHLVALHKVGSNNPDGVEIKKKKDAKGIPLDGIPFHPYYTVKDIVGVTVFLMVFSAIIFFAPGLGGKFLEKDNFIPANILSTPLDIVPLWDFSPVYSMLGASITDLTHGMLAFGTGAVAALAFFTRRGFMAKMMSVVVAAVLILGMFTLQAKLWGVIMMGSSIVLIFFLPWLDRSPVKSIRYRGPLYKGALAIFVVSFVLLGYLGSKSPDAVSLVFFKNVTWSQILTLLYMAFFVLMPWYTKIDKTRPVPERVTFK